MLNHDAYFTLGDYTIAGYRGDRDMPVDHSRESAKNMAERISLAWASALGLSMEQAGGLVHFPDNPVYSVTRNDIEFTLPYIAVFQ